MGSLLSIETLYLRGISIYRCTPYYVSMYVYSHVCMYMDVSNAAGCYTGRRL